jgi:glycosyltransferase involved in cell wall biosynthesis
MHFSVGIPTFNNEDSIARTIEIFEQQTIYPTEVVFCDSSSDKTTDIIEKKAQEVDEFDIILLEQTGDGVAQAYNQILQYLDEDYDIFGTIQTTWEIDKDWVENAIHIHKKHTDIDIITPCGNFHGKLDKSDRKYFTGRNFVAKQGVLESVDGWDENFFRGEDWDIRIRLASAGITTFGTDLITHENIVDDPEVTLRKAIRKPHSVMFLAKYGTWYIKYHPIHVLSNILSLSAIFGIIASIFTPPYGVAIVLLATGSYIGGYIITEGSAKDSVTDIIKGQIFDGVGVIFSILRLVANDYEWNYSGFDP